MYFPFITRRTPATAVDIPELSFRPLRLTDMAATAAILRYSGSRACDYTVGGLFMWADCFRYRRCFHRGTLFISGVAENDPAVTAFSLPCGDLPVADALELIARYCRFKGIAPMLTAVPEDRLDAVRAALPRATVTPLDDWADYIYDVNDLATLRGKRLMRKRNHYNRFMADNPRWRFEALTHEQLPEASLFLAGCGRSAADTAPSDATVSPYESYEHDACREVLAHIAAYPFEGAVLRDDSGEIAAFTVGEVIGDTLHVHIEKINHSVSGAGAAICKLFAAYMLRRHPSLRYVNRQEDCGDPGLRRAKESFAPLTKLTKYNVAFNL